MAGIGQTLLSMLGGGDPEQDISDYSNQELVRNRAAAGEDPQGNLWPAPAVNSPTAVGAGALTPDAASISSQQSGILPASQESNATKTPQSWGSLLMSLQRNNERSQGLNQSIGTGFAAFAQPRDREMVSKMFNVDQPDPTKIINAQINASSAQQINDRLNGIGQMVNDPTRGPALAKRLNISWDELRARYQSDPLGVGNMIQTYASPTDPMKNIQQMTAWQNQLRAKGATPGDLSLLTPSLVAAVGPDFAQKAIGDAVSYRSTHNGKEAPWVGPGGVNVQAYNQWAKDQGAISDAQNTAAGNLSSSLQTTDTLRQKLMGLQNNPGLQKILAAPNDSPLKQAAWNAINDPDPNWQKNIVQAVLVNDPQAMQAISELKEINGQEYTSAIHSLLGHGLRPSQTEVGAVREGFGQTKNVNLFGGPNAMKDYNAQAIQPLLTRLDEAQAEGCGSSGQLQNAPERLRPFIDKTYLTGGRMHLDDGAAPQPWESQIHKPLSDQQRTTLANQITHEPGNAFYYRDKLRRQGFDVDI